MPSRGLLVATFPVKLEVTQLTREMPPFFLAHPWASALSTRLPRASGF